MRMVVKRASNDFEIEEIKRFDTVQDLIDYANKVNSNLILSQDYDSKKYEIIIYDDYIE